MTYDMKILLGTALFLLSMFVVFGVIDMAQTQQTTDRYNTCVAAGGEFQRDGRDFTCKLP